MYIYINFKLDSDTENKFEIIRISTYPEPNTDYNKNYGYGIFRYKSGNENKEEIYNQRLKVSRNPIEKRQIYGLIEEGWSFEYSNDINQHIYSIYYKLYLFCSKSIRTRYCHEEIIKKKIFREEDIGGTTYGKIKELMKKFNTNDLIILKDTVGNDLKLTNVTYDII